MKRIIMVACMVSITLTGCGYKGPLKSPAQAAQDKAQKEQESKNQVVGENSAGTGSQ